MSSGGDGGGLLGLENFGSGGGGNFFENIANSYAQTISGGTVQVNDNGFKFDPKNSTALNVYKEVSGANAAEKALDQSQKQFEEQRKAADKARKDQLNQNAREQIEASRQAGAARTASASRSGNTRAAAGRINSLGSEPDLLGL